MLHSNAKEHIFSDVRFVYLSDGHIFWMLYASFQALHKALDV